MLSPLPIKEAVARGQRAGVPAEYTTSNNYLRLLHAPAAAAALGHLIKSLSASATLPARYRELAILRVGWRSHAEYVFCRHVPVASKHLTREEILGVRDPSSCPAFGAIERAVLKMTDELLDSAEVSPDTWRELGSRFSAQELVELILVAGNWRMVASFTKTAKVPLEAGFEGWPEGRAPA
jgi:alkylhydroperoxidase family enzyme